MAFFKHDCDNCTYVGSYRDKRERFDFYIHVSDDWEQEDWSAIMRFGDEGSEYQGSTVGRLIRTDRGNYYNEAMEVFLNSAVNLGVIKIERLAYSLVP